MQIKKENRFKLLYRSDYEKRLFLERALKICHEVIAKKNFEIGVLTSERDETEFLLQEERKRYKSLKAKF